METINLTCERCGSQFERPAKEHKRSVAKGRRVFCSLSCTAIVGNASRRAKEIVKVCPHCKKTFQSSTHNKAATFCSRSCAASGSMTEARKVALSQLGKLRGGMVCNFWPVEKLLRSREAWKYELLKKVLAGRSHEFEYRLGAFVFDLALFDTKVLVEFDGKEHGSSRQKEIDQQKDQFARAAGFVVIRRPVVSVAVIDPSVIDGL